MLPALDQRESLPDLGDIDQLRKGVAIVLGNPDFQHTSNAFLVCKNLVLNFSENDIGMEGLIEGLDKIDKACEEALQPKKKEEKGKSTKVDPDAPVKFLRKKSSRIVTTKNLQKEIDDDCTAIWRKLNRESESLVAQFEGMIANLEEKVGKLYDNEAWQDKTKDKKVVYLIVNLLLAIRKGLAVQYNPDSIKNLAIDHPAIQKIFKQIDGTRKYFEWLLPIFQEN